MFGLRSPSTSKKTRKIILHIGAPKCASSTLQSYLSHVFAHGQTVQRSDAEKIRYFAFSTNGQVWTGEKLKIRLATSNYGYISSVGFGPDKTSFEEGIKNVLHKTKSNQIPVLSCEAWILHKFKGDMRDVFERLNVEVEIFAVIRPPLDYLNASWWQWGVWTQAQVGPFLRRQLDQVMWYRHLDHWKNMPGVTRLEVVDLRDNVLGAFKTFLGATDDWDERSNSGSSTALLDFLLTQPDHLGRTVHDPSIEFALNRYVPQPACPKPFILGPQFQQLMIDETKDSVHENRKFFSNAEKAEAHVNDPAYSSIEYYEGRVLRGMKKVAWPIERYKFRVAMSEYFHANPRPNWMPASFDLAAMDAELRVLAQRFG